MKREPKPHGIETRRLTTETHTRAVFVLVKTCSYKLINGTVCALFRTPGGTPLYMPWVCADPSGRVLACKIIRFSSPPTAKSEEKRMFTQTSRFLPRFGLKTGMGFEGTAECLRIYSFNSKWERKKEKYANSKWIFFVCSLIIVSNDNIISAKKGQVLKRVWISEF